MINPRTRRRLAALTLAGVSFVRIANADPFYMGGDVSLLPFIESHGGSFRDGTVQPADHIMVDRGGDLFRIRLFVNPNTNYAATAGAIQDQASAVALAQRLKASGAKVLLDLQYSDTWADPGHQAKPAAWTALSSAALQTKVHDYTRDTLLAFRDAGVMPDLVQVGNEVTNGMLYSTGQVVYTGSTATQNASWASFGSLLNAGISGIRDADALVPGGHHTMIAIHCDGGTIQNRAAYYFNQLATVGGVNPASYDIAGMSFYPDSANSLTYLQGNLNYIAGSTPLKAMVMETNTPWKGTANGGPWPATQAGQLAELVAVRDAVRGLPNNRGLGVVWWYPESIQIPGYSIYKGGATSLFDDSGGEALPALDAFSLPAPTWAINSDGTWSGAANWTGGVPSGAGVEARFTSAITASHVVTLDSARTIGSIRFLSAPSYSLAGTSTLTLDALGDAPAHIDVLAGSHTIDVPITLAADTEVNVAWANSLAITQPIAGASSRLTKLGSGVATLASVHVQTLDVEFGTAKFASHVAPNDPAGTSTVGAIVIVPGATCDLTNNAMVIDYSGSVGMRIGDLRELLAAGRLTSSLADSTHAIGFADNAILGRPDCGGLNVDATSVLLGFALRGDTNLNGAVDFNDVLTLSQHYGAISGAVWTDGDFNYDGVVNFDDLLVLAQTYGSSLPGDVSMNANWASMLPEPAPFLGIVSILLFLRRR